MGWRRDVRRRLACFWRRLREVWGRWWGISWYKVACADREDGGVDDDGFLRERQSCRLGYSWKAHQGGFK